MECGDRMTASSSIRTDIFTEALFNSAADKASEIVINAFNETENQMKSLDEHNSSMLEIYRKERYLGNGIECPECTNELVDNERGVVLASVPPRTSVMCGKCGFVGTRIV